MRILYEEIRKIVRQSLGTENIFGYKSTVANQLYLLYCFSGKIHFTDRVDKRVKHLWYSLVSILLLFSFIVFWSYLWYDDKSDLVLMLNVAVSLGCNLMATLGFPIILYLFSDGIEALIEHVDTIMMNPKNQSITLITVKKEFFQFFIPFVVSTLVFLSASSLDVILFFEEDKVSIYTYYAYPPPLIQMYDSFAAFVMMSGVTIILFAFMIFEASLVFALMLYWNVICCGQLVNIKDGLYSYERTSDLNLNDATFEYIFRNAVREFQTATRLINYMRGCVELIGSILNISTFGYGVALLYVCLSNDMPLMLKIKCGSGYFTTVLGSFLFYLIGQNLDTTLAEVSLAVYCTPWYRSVKIRKTAYILLCQTQSIKPLATFRVYGLLFQNFSRYLHAQISYTNILRQLTRK